MYFGKERKEGREIPGTKNWHGSVYAIPSHFLSFSSLSLSFSFLDVFIPGLVFIRSLIKGDLPGKVERITGGFIRDLFFASGLYF